MSVKHAKDCLAMIGKTYPTIGGLMKKRVGDCLLWDHWAALLAECDADHLENVCVEIAELERLPVPAGHTTDAMPFFIRKEANARRGADRDRLEQLVKHHSKPETARVSERMDQLIRAGKIRESERTQRLGALLRWDRGGTKPEWVERELEPAQ